MEDGSAESEVEVEHGQLWRRIYWARASTQSALCGAATRLIDGLQQRSWDREGRVARAVNCGTLAIVSPILKGQATVPDHRAVKSSEGSQAALFMHGLWFSAFTTRTTGRAGQNGFS